jgi:hypothetical protein
MCSTETLLLGYLNWPYNMVLTILFGICLGRLLPNKYLIISKNISLYEKNRIVCPNIYLQQDLVNYVLWRQLFIGGETHNNQRNQNIQPVVKNTNMY